MNHEIHPPSAEELSVLFDGLADNSCPVALLSTVPKYADLFISTPDEEPNLPPPLSSIYRDEYREVLYLEHATQKQNGCLEWLEH